MTTRSDSLAIVDGQLRYAQGGRAIWSLEIDRLAIIGEFTADAPGDDYELLFIDRDGICFQISFYTPGLRETLDALSARLGSPVRCGLCNSIEFRSRVLWPPDLVDRPVLADSPRPPAGFLDRLLRFLGLGSTPVPFSAEVFDFLDTPGPGSGDRTPVSTRRPR